jgi:hypothetical protein
MSLKGQSPVRTRGQAHCALGLVPWNPPPGPESCGSQRPGEQHRQVTPTLVEECSFNRLEKDKVNDGETEALGEESKKNWGWT